MLAQCSGLVFTIPSTAGIASTGDFPITYAASKLGVDGFMEGLAREAVAPVGIRTMLVEPGFFGTELLTPQSTRYAEPSVEDYADRTMQTFAAWKGMDGTQNGTPAKLAAALAHLAALENPPARLLLEQTPWRSSTRPMPSSPKQTDTSRCPPASPTMTDDWPRQPLEELSFATGTPRRRLRLPG